MTRDNKEALTGGAEDTKSQGSCEYCANLPEDYIGNLCPLCEAQKTVGELFDMINKHSRFRPIRAALRDAKEFKYFALRVTSSRTWECETVAEIWHSITKKAYYAGIKTSEELWQKLRELETVRAREAHQKLIEGGL